MVDLFCWKEEYSVGVAHIDAQHKKLVSLLNQMHRSMCEGAGVAILDNVLSQLISYTREHFAEEERLMQAARYPEFESHRAEHRNLTEKVIAFQQEFQSGKTTMTLKVMTFLKEWLQHHILFSDKRYKPYLLLAKNAGRAGGGTRVLVS